MGLGRVSHPFQHDLIVPDGGLSEALLFELNNSPDFIDAFRSFRMGWLLARAEALGEDRVRSVEHSPDDIEQIASRAHGPLIQE